MHSARKFAANTRSIEDAQTDATFRQRFNLPATEFPVTSTWIPAQTDVRPLSLT
jgi:hypothetical protein